MAEHPDAVDPQHPLIERVREMCLAYPDAFEQRAWGRPTFRVNKRIFAIAAATMERPYSLVFKPDPADEPALRQDSRFWLPPYWGPFGWLAIDFDGTAADWREIAELVDASYRQFALKRHLQALDREPRVSLI